MAETSLGPNRRKLLAEELRRFDFPPLPEKPGLWEKLCAAIENGPRGQEEKLFKEFLQLHEQRFEGQAWTGYHGLVLTMKKIFPTTSDLEAFPSQPSNWVRVKLCTPPLRLENLPPQPLTNQSQTMFFCFYVFFFGGGGRSIEALWE